MPSRTRTTAYVTRTLGEIDRRSVPAHLIDDVTYIERLTWKAFDRSQRNSEAIVAGMQMDKDATFFIDNCFIDDETEPAEIAELLSAPGRLRITHQVHQELEPFLRARPSHPIAQALRDKDPAVLLHPTLAPSAPGRLAMEFYVSLLMRRRSSADVVRAAMARERGGRPEDQDEREVLARVQRTYGERGLLLARKQMSPLATDEILVYRAVEHAVRTGQQSVILTKDPDLEEQFFKLTWLLCSHYKAMLAANRYACDFGSFLTIPVSERVRDDDWWPIQDGGAVLVDGEGWGDGRDGVLPAFYRFVAVGCWNVGPVVSQMVFGAEREMARVLDVKDRTRGRSTDQLGQRNVHFDVPENMRPANDPCQYVMVARDITVNLFGSTVEVPWLDIGHALLSNERPRRVVLEEPSSALDDPRPRLTIVPPLPGY